VKPECDSHRQIKIHEGTTTELICECGKWARVTYRGSAWVTDAEGDNYYEGETNE
jgi:hypothetical protein